MPMEIETKEVPVMNIQSARVQTALPEKAQRKQSKKLVSGFKTINFCNRGLKIETG